MVPLYAARLSDLRPGDFVVVKCGASGHDGLIHPAALPSLGLGLLSAKARVGAAAPNFTRSTRSGR
jgi:hypothetical protein